MRIFIVVMVLLLVSLAAAALLLDPGKGIGDFGISFSSKESGTEVRTEPVRTGTLVETVSAPGEIEPNTKVDI